MAWSYSPAHGYVLVPLAPPAPPRAAGSPIYLPPQSDAALPGGNNVVPFRGAHKSCQLVRPGNRDTYAEFLSGVPDISPHQAYGYLAPALMPEDADMDPLLSDPSYSPPAPVNPNTTINEDPSRDAFGRGVQYAHVKPLIVLAGETKKDE